MRGGVFDDEGSLSGSRPRLAVATAVATTAALAAWVAHAFWVDRAAAVSSDGRVGLVFDDAYMFVRYADHVLQGHGFAWNAGEGPVHGNTSALFAAQMVGARSFLPGDPGHTALAASFIDAALALALLAALVSVLARRFGAPGPAWAWGAAAVPAVLIDVPFRYAALTGMDTALAVAAAATVALAAVRVADSGRRGAVVLAGALGWLAVEARPDVGLLALGWLFGVAWAAGAWRRGASAAALTLALCAASTAAKAAYFGDALPLAFSVKASGFYEGYATGWRWNPADSLLEVLRWTAPFLGLFLAGFRVARWRWYLAFAAPVLATWGYFFTVVQFMGFHGRYYLPGAVGVVALGAIGAAEVSASRRVSWRALAAGAPLALAIAWPAPLAALYEARWLSRFDPAPERFYVQPRPPPFRKINPSTMALVRILSAAPVRLAATEHGLLGARLPGVPILDLTGLHDPAFAHGGFSMDRVVAVAPPLMWMPFPDYVGMTRALYCDPRLWEGWRVYPAVFRFGIAVRRDAPASLHAAVTTPGVNGPL